MKLDPRLKQESKSQANFFKKTAVEVEDPFSMKIVKNELKKSINIKESMEVKKRSVNKILGDYKFCSLEEYDSKEKI